MWLATGCPELVHAFLLYPLSFYNWPSVLNPARFPRLLYGLSSAICPAPQRHEEVHGRRHPSGLQRVSNGLVDSEMGRDR